MSNDAPLTKPQLVREIRDNYGLDIESTGTLIVKIIDYKDNPIAPERYCYKVFYTDPLTGRRASFAYYPNTVGMQPIVR